ncbi:hypothetical protein M422DRAFT_261573 [Sphaerobolus stellatus SS14]|uniref:Uncharacterized protein n=1 Tax=Sphaerobolus stellatus (strain SS14) TaxID=990650 RepID=A0A0C9VF33_SPHS4|nr:hypothetical protein M422DRAFT_261573 [Sphaerobolus stellatus SS14]
MAPLASPAKKRLTAKQKQRRILAVIGGIAAAAAGRGWLDELLEGNDNRIKD